MPPVAIAVAAAAAGYGAAAAAVAAGIITGMATFGAVMIMTTVSVLVAYGMNALMGTGSASALGASDRKMMVRGSVQPRRFVYGKARSSGVLVYAGSSGNKSQDLHLVIALATHKCQSIGDIYIEDNQIAAEAFNGSGDVVSGKYAGKVKVKRYLGDQTAADADLIAACGADWTSAHIGYGVTYIYVKLTYDSKLFSGIPNISAIVEGKSDIYDPRSETTGYTNNPALCIRDYLLHPMGLDSLPQEINEDYFAAAANACDELVDLNADGSLTQKRYTLNGSFALDQKYIDIVENMLTSCLGALPYVQGQYRLHPAIYEPPSDALTADDIAGAVEVVARPDLADLFNTVTGKYISPDDFYQETDIPEVSLDTYVVEDGETISKDITLPYTTNEVEAQRLARIMLRREREAVTINATVRYAGIRYCVWQMISVSIEELGFVDKPFRVYNWKFDPIGGTVQLTLREESAYSYAWNYDDAEHIGQAPNTTLINPLDVPEPTDLTVTPSTYINADGAAVPSLVVEWTEAASAFVTADEVQWRLGTTGPWNGAQVASGTGRFVIAPVEAGAVYQVRVRAIANLSVSEWTGAVDAEGLPDTVPPGEPTDMVVTGGIKQISIVWTNPNDLDLDRIEVWENDSDDAGTRYKVNETSTDFITIPMDAALERHYWLRAVDRSGNRGSFVYAGFAVSRYAATNDIAVGATFGINVNSFGAGASSDWPLEVTGGSEFYNSTMVVTGQANGIAFWYPPDGEGVAATTYAYLELHRAGVLLKRQKVWDGSGIIIWVGPVAAGPNTYSLSIVHSEASGTAGVTDATLSAEWKMR